MPSIATWPCGTMTPGCTRTCAPIDTWANTMATRWARRGTTGIRRCWHAGFEAIEDEGPEGVAQPGEAEGLDGHPGRRVERALVAALTERGHEVGAHRGTETRVAHVHRREPSRHESTRRRNPPGLNVREYFSIAGSATKLSVPVEDLLHRLGRTGPERGPHRMAVDDRVGHHHVRPDRHERRVGLELPDRRGPVGQRAEHDEAPAPPATRSAMPATMTSSGDHRRAA